MTSFWVPAVAAVGASGLTGLTGFGAIVWNQRHIDRSASSASQAEACRLLVEHSLSFTRLANALRRTADSRSGPSDGFDAALGIRRPFEPLALYDRLAAGYGPISTAWTTIKVSGQLETVQLADQLVRACGDLLEVAGEVGAARGRLQTKLRGPAWSVEQRNALQTTSEQVMSARSNLIQHSRAEFGNGAGWTSRTRDERPPGL
jgi:hypothetical protein